MIANRFVNLALVAATVFSLPACEPADPGSDDAELGEDFSELATVAQSSIGLASLKIVGSLEYGETSAKIHYTKTPTYRAFKFAGDTGDTVTIDVRAQGGGDPMVWLLDDSFVTVAQNDDISASNHDSRITTVLPAHPSRTHYIVVREYAKKAFDFKVKLQGVKAVVDLTSCQRDEDCEKVAAGCCRKGFTAIRTGMEDAYRSSLSCEGVFCTLEVTPPIDDVAQCNNNTKQCELTDPLAIACGGHTINMHTCPDGFLCQGPGLKFDATGTCRQPCGGFGSLPCANDATCVDDPTDDCTVETGGNDCGGICQPKLCLGFGNLSCPESLVCIDDPNDSCDVATGGNDCAGLCANK